MFGNFFRRAADRSDVDHEAFARAVREGRTAVVDVREPHEFAAGHIPGAVNLPLSRFNPLELPKGKPVILICQAGGRSRRALHQTHATGRNDVKHYSGGMRRWRSEG